MRCCSDNSQRFYLDFINIRLKPKTVASYQDILNRILLPRFGDIELTVLRRTDVFQMVCELSDRPILANRTVAVGSALYGRAEMLELIPPKFNPFHGCRIYRENQRDRFLSVAECERVAQVLHHFERNRLASPYAVAGIRMLMLTSARLSKIETLKWQDVDLTGQFISLADSKTGPRRVEMPPIVVDLLRGLDRCNDFVFP